jgi:(R,R)-butanediol dehydrogenase/meso-butanediol dehydrogenase/diacetyl reductase
VEEAPQPVPGRGLVAIKVCRCGICSSDVNLTSETVAALPINTVIGHEVAGEVIEVGPGVDKLKVGDHVTGFAVQQGCGQCPACVEGVPHWCTGGGNLGNYGGYAQFSMLKELFALKLPKTISMNDAALIEPLACSLHGVAMAQIQPGARVLIIGAGPIGLGAIFWARHMGAAKVAVMARSNRRQALATQMGADHFISGKHDNPADVVQETLGVLPDVVIECTGMPGTLAEAINLVRVRGTIIVLGFCMAADTIHPAASVSKELTIKCSMMYNMQDYERVADTLDAGFVNPSLMVTKTVNLDQLPEVFQGLRGPNDECKVMVDPWG